MDALGDDALATIAQFLPLLRDVILFARSCRRLATLLQRTITSTRDGPAAAAQRLQVNHLKKSVAIERQVDPSDIGELVRLSAVLTNLE
jgi:hypothetical protein